MEKKSVPKLFFGGVPTEADVKKLRERWGETEMNPGDVFLYEDIEKILQVSRKSSRFQTVTSRWRYVVMKATDIVIGPIGDGTGLKVLSESGKFALICSRLREAARKGRVAYVISTKTDRKQLSEEERKGLDHAQKVCGAILASAQLRKNQPVLPEV